MNSTILQVRVRFYKRKYPIRTAVSALQCIPVLFFTLM